MASGCPRPRSRVGSTAPIRRPTSRTLRSGTNRGGTAPAKGARRCGAGSRRRSRRPLVPSRPAERAMTREATRTRESGVGWHVRGGRRRLHGRAAGLACRDGSGCSASARSRAIPCNAEHSLRATSVRGENRLHRRRRVETDRSIPFVQRTQSQDGRRQCLGTDVSGDLGAIAPRPLVSSTLPHGVPLRAAGRECLDEEATVPRTAGTRMRRRGRRVP